MARRSMAAVVVCLGFLMMTLAGSARAETTLDLLEGRFLVTATWRTPSGAHGDAQAVPLTNETGLFWFFSKSNVELVVKILNACDPFQRFWVYAGGLTNIQVELTVLDTWTGQTETYSRSPGALFSPIADTSTFNGCSATSGPCGQGTSAQIAATPRPNAEAEALALLLGPGVTADPVIYARLDDDLMRIRALHPSLDDVGFALLWDPSSLFIELTPSGYDALQAGKFHEWDCLNRWYGAEVTHIYGSGDALLHFEGLFHPVRIGAGYEALPGVEKASVNAIGYPAGGPIDDLCVTVNGTAYEYFFDDQSGGGQVWYLRVPQPGAAPVVVGQVERSGPQPGWWPLFEQCREDLREAAEH